MDFLEKLIGTDRAIIAGLVGALIALKFQEELNTWHGKLIFVLTGIGCAYYATPLAMSWYGIDAGLAGSVGFLFGAFGGSLLAASFKAIRNMDLKELVKVLTENFKGGSK